MDMENLLIRINDLFHKIRIMTFGCGLRIENVSCMCMVIEVLPRLFTVIRCTMMFDTVKECLIKGGLV